MIRWLVALVFTGCFGSAPESVYYVLEAPPANAGVASPRTSSVLVRRFTTAPGYDRAELVYRTHERQLRLHQYDLWASRPGRMVSDVIAQHLANARLFASVITKTGASVVPEYELRGEVQVIDARQISDKEWVARLEARMELVAIADESVVWQHSFGAEKPIAKHTPAATVEALDAILADELGRITASLDESLPR